ncbi:hypothetical protein AA313_de0209887 [Arthrobotrys entomopaga]|nr:hypothetical protein AA313_de0209887 [Arthrobotrys entomopaga]
MIHLPRVFTSPLFFFFAYTGLVARTAAQQRCVYPDGSASSDTPCISNNSSLSSYYGARDYCLDNGLCISSSTQTYWRGSCTNENWSGCSDLCTTVISNGAAALQLCENGAHCCSPDYDDFSCCNGTVFVNGPYPYNFVVLPRGEQVEAAGLVTSGTTVTTTATATATVSAATCTSTTEGQLGDTCPGGSGSKKVTVVAVGATLGSLLGVAIAVIGWQYWRMEKLKKGYESLIGRPTAGGIVVLR